MAEAATETLPKLDPVGPAAGPDAGAPAESGDVPTEAEVEEQRAARVVGYPRPLVFLHIPKAAGTTLQSFIMQHYRKGVRAYRFTGSREQLEKFRTMPQAQRDSFDLLLGHVNYGIHELVSAPATYLTMLRDPVERIISHYYFILAHPEHYLHTYVAGRGYTLHEYATAGLNQEGDNNHVRWLTPRLHTEVPLGQVTRGMLEEAKWNLANGVSVFGLAERFTDSLRCFAAAFGWDPVPPRKRLNVNRARPKQDQVAPETIEAIRDSNRYDVELHEYAKALFEEQMVRLSVRPLKSEG
ncbi:MAG: sulfotransferase family 2 domain-containing protein [Phycisphaerales bacterium]